MGIIYKEKEDDGLKLAGYPIKKSFFKKNEVLHFDKIRQRWVAAKARGTVITVSETEPTDKEVGDIWIEY